ncbi:MAG: hypothetical protein ACR2G4_18675 [Pyrinomonadaceae bacterium]
MSEENTQNMSQRYDTKPTIETVLERLSALGTEMREGFARIEKRLDNVDKRLDDFDVRLDRMESDVSKTRSEMLTLRADFKELRAHLKEPA